MFGRKKPDFRDPDLTDTMAAGLEAGAALKRLVEKPAGQIDSQTASDLALVLTVSEVTLAEMVRVLAGVRKRLQAAGAAPERR